MVAPPLEGAVGRAFSGDPSVVELVLPSTARSRAYVEAVLEDSRSVECESYESETNTGATQHVSDIRILDLSDIGEIAVGFTATVEVQGATGSVGAVLIGDHGWFAFIQFFGNSLPPADVIVTLAERAADRLAG